MYEIVHNIIMYSVCCLIMKAKDLTSYTAKIFVCLLVDYLISKEMKMMMDLHPPPPLKKKRGKKDNNNNKK